MLQWIVRVAVHLILATLSAGAGLAAQQRIAPPASARQADSRDMALLGYSDLQARSAYQPTIHRQGDRYIAYIGHHGGQQMNPLTGQMERNGTSVVDVTNPRAPRQIAHIPGEAGAGEQGGAQMTRVCNGSDLPRADRSKVYLLRSYGNSGHEIWDVTDPAKPSKILTLLEGLRNTHKNFWECETGIAYVVSGPRDWRVRRMTKIYDLSNPAAPVFIRDFGLHGQQPGTTGNAPTELHGPVSIGPKGNRVYFGYGTARAGVVQIVDREKLLKGSTEPTEANLLYPQISRMDMPPSVGAHNVFPLLRMPIAEFAKEAESTRDMLVIVDEAIGGGCMATARAMMWIADITTETKPFGASTWTVPEASGNFCSRGGRFGTHASHENFTPIYYNRIMLVAHFNAGIRAVDVRDPFNPKEIAYYIPALGPTTFCTPGGNGLPCVKVIQTNNVEVDDRGYIYGADRAGTGLHIVELTGAARSVANFR